MPLCLVYKWERLKRTVLKIQLAHTSVYHLKTSTCFSSSVSISAVSKNTLWKKECIGKEEQEVLESAEWRIKKKDKKKWECKPGPGRSEALITFLTVFLNSLRSLPERDLFSWIVFCGFVSFILSTLSYIFSLLGVSVGWSVQLGLVSPSLTAL